MKQTSTELKGEIDSYTIIVRDYNVPLLKMDKTARQKINKVTDDMTKIIDRLELTDIYRT